MEPDFNIFQDRASRWSNKLSIERVYGPLSLINPRNKYKVDISTFIGEDNDTIYGLYGDGGGDYSIIAFDKTTKEVIWVRTLNKEGELEIFKPVSTCYSKYRIGLWAVNTSCSTYYILDTRTGNTIFRNTFLSSHKENKLIITDDGTLYEYSAYHIYCPSVRTIDISTSNPEYINQLGLSLNEVTSKGPFLVDKLYTSVCLYDKRLHLCSLEMMSLSIDYFENNFYILRYSLSFDGSNEYTLSRRSVNDMSINDNNTLLLSFKKKTKILGIFNKGFIVIHSGSKIIILDLFSNNITKIKVGSLNKYYFNSERNRLWYKYMFKLMYIEPDENRNIIKIKGRGELLNNNSNIDIDGVLYTLL